MSSGKADNTLDGGVVGWLAINKCNRLGVSVGPLRQFVESIDRYVCSGEISSKISKKIGEGG